MNIPMQQPGPMGMNPMVQSSPVQMGPGPHGMHPNQPPMQQPQEKFDNISKVKSLMNPLRDSLSVALKSAAQTLFQNNLIDTSKGTDPQDYHFNKNIEEFFAICDQMELHLKTSIECINQHSMATRYMPVNVNPLRIENIPSPDALTYPQYLMTARSQVQYTQDIHNALSNAARAISQNE